MRQNDRWVDINVDKTLVERIEKVIKKVKDDYGRTKYTSRVRFIDEAITEKLKQMEVTN